MNRSAKNLREFESKVHAVLTDEKAAKFVRGMTVRVAKDNDCPLPLLQKLGQCIADYRKAELTEEAERN